MINTPLGMAIDVDAMRPALAAGTGGLSGPAIRPLAVRCQWQVHAALPGVPIIGMGGVMTGRDALELILAGACVVAVGTAIFNDPYACLRILRELEDLLHKRGFERLADAVGLAHRPPGSGPRGRIDLEESSLGGPPPSRARSSRPTWRPPPAWPTWSPPT